MKIGKRIQLIDSEAITEMFKKLKNKGIAEKTISMKLEKYNKENLPQVKDYIDQFIYYRNLRGYTQEQVGQVIGISGKSYYKYEKRIHKLTDISKIEKIKAFLKIEEELKMLPNVSKINNNELKKYLISNNISNMEFSKLTGISRRSIVDWFNKDVEISAKNCQKIIDFIENFENKKEENQEEMEYF